MRSTLDTLAFEAERGDDRRRARLRGPRPPDRPRRRSSSSEVEAVLSHPQPLAQCARFLREQLPGVERRSVSSTAAAVRMVSESVRPWAAIGARAAAELYGCAILREGIEDEADNVTRFVWIAPAGTEAGRRRDLEDLAGLLRARRGPSRAPWSTRCSEFSEPRDQPDPDRVAAAAPGPRPLHVLLRPRGRRGEDPRSRRRSRRCATKADSVRILGSYPVGTEILAAPSAVPLQFPAWHGFWCSMRRTSR